jgi:ATP-dependent DNA helicase DinG
MRHRGDRGVVLVADGRIVKKPYGGLFIASLPETKQIRSTTQDVLRRVEQFLEETQP